jgi:glycogen operon protein
MFEFWKAMIALRMKHDVIRGKARPAACGFKDVSVHGIMPHSPRYGRDDRYIGVMYAGRALCDTRDDIIYIGMNMWWEKQKVTLPNLPNGMCWYKAVYTWEEPYAVCESARVALKDGEFEFEPRSIAVFIAV